MPARFTVSKAPPPPPPPPTPISKAVHHFKRECQVEAPRPRLRSSASLESMEAALNAPCSLDHKTLHTPIYNGVHRPVPCLQWHLEWEAETAAFCAKCQVPEIIQGIFRIQLEEQEASPRPAISPAQLSASYSRRTCELVLPLICMPAFERSQLLTDCLIKDLGRQLHYAVYMKDNPIIKPFPGWNPNWIVRKWFSYQSLLLQELVYAECRKVVAKHPFRSLLEACACLRISKVVEAHFEDKLRGKLLALSLIQTFILEHSK